MKARLFLILLIAATILSAKPVPSDWIQPPIVVVAENVKVSVGESMALIVGRYWYQYVKRFDDRSSGNVPIYYTAFVPESVTEYRDLLEVSQVKLMVGEREFRPESARLLTDDEIGRVPTLPHGTGIAWFTFQIPREFAELRFAVVISHYQPHYIYEGKSVSAYYPWLPNLEPLRKELELLDKHLTVTFEALPGVTFATLTNNDRIIKSTPQRLELTPAHQEIIAVSVLPADAK